MQALPSVSLIRSIVISIGPRFWRAAGRQLNAARETLLDPEQRRQYDRQRALASPARPANARDGFDIHETVTITAAQAAAGVIYRRPFHRPDGTPFTLEIPIPPGVAGGTRLSLPGAGVRGFNGGRDGDFILTVWVAEAATHGEGDLRRVAGVGGGPRPARAAPPSR